MQRIVRIVVLIIVLAGQVEISVVIEQPCASMKVTSDPGGSGGGTGGGRI